MDKVLLFDMEFISDRNYDRLIIELLSYTNHPDSNLPLLITPNVDQVVKMHQPDNEALAVLLRKSTWILPDGQPLVWLSRYIYGGTGLESRLTGSDFFPQIWRSIKENRRRVFFILPDASLGEKLKIEYSAVEFYSPPYFNISDANEIHSIFSHSLDSVIQAKPDFLFIGLGFPKQELLAVYLLEKLSEQGFRLPVTLLLGASFEFYFGTKKRAPKIFQKLGLEFLHRLISEPGRMFRRYLVDDLAFFPLALSEIRKHKKARKRFN